MSDYNNSEVEYLDDLVNNQDNNVEKESTVIFTSGTSSYPKGAVLTHQSMLAGILAVYHQFVPYHLS